MVTIELVIPSATADALLGCANGPAADLLFSAAQNIPSVLMSTPDPSAVLARWPKLSAESCIALAAAVRDPVALDAIVWKEKRKTVRRALASNEHLSGCTRLYLLQEGLSDHDYDLVANALQAMAWSEYVATLVGCADIRRHVSISSIAYRCAQSLDRDGTVRLLGVYGARLAAELLAQVPAFAMSTGDAAGVDWSTVELRTLALRGTPMDDLAALWAKMPTENTARAIIHAFGKDVHLVGSIDVRLLERALGAYAPLSAEMVETARQHNLLEALHAATRFSDAAAAEALCAACGPLGAPGAVVYHPDIERGVSLVQADLEEFTQAAWRVCGPRDTTEWLCHVAPIVGLDEFWKAVLCAKATLEGKHLTLLRHNGFTAEQTISSMPLRALPQLDTLPGDLDMAAFLERARCDGSPAEQHAAACLVLDTRSAHFMRTPATAGVAAIELLEQSAGLDAVRNWLSRRGDSRAVRDFVAAFVDKHPQRGAELLSHPGLHRFVRFCADTTVVPLMRPAGGWGHVLPDVPVAVWETLASHVGDDLVQWETVLTMLDRWTGTLEELADAAKRLGADH